MIRNLETDRVAKFKKFRNLLRDLKARPSHIFLKILSWNVKGLGRPLKCHLVKDVILTSQADIVYLQEFKLQEIHSSTWRSIGGMCINTFNFLPALGIASGIIITWDLSQVNGTLIHKGTFSITIEFTMPDLSELISGMNYVQ